MAGKPSASKLMAEMLEADFVEFTTGRNSRCRLCNLPKEQAEALELICQKRKETGRPTFESAVAMLAHPSIAVKTSEAALRDHYRKHWDGEKPAANRS